MHFTYSIKGFSNKQNNKTFQQKLVIKILLPPFSNRQIQTDFLFNTLPLLPSMTYN